MKRFKFSRPADFLIVSGTNRSEFDVFEGDVSTRTLGLDVSRIAAILGTRSSQVAGFAGVASDRVIGIQPEHPGLVIVPHGHDQDHAASHSFSHLSQAAELVVMVKIAETTLRIEIVFSTVLSA